MSNDTGSRVKEFVAEREMKVTTMHFKRKEIH